MKKLICLLILVIVGGGCAPLYHIRTSGFLDMTEGITKIPTEATFAVLENKKALNPIFEKEVKSKIEKLLVKNGYSIESLDKAQYCLTFYYTIDRGRTVTDSVPAYNPGKTTYQYGTFDVYGSGGKHRYGSYSKWSTTPGHTTYVPTNYTQYTAILMLKVIDADSFGKDKKEKVVWIGDTINANSSSDLREIIDYLLIATFEYFGQDTGKRIKTILPSDSKEVKELRQ